MKALTDVKILDLSQKLTVNLATMYLAGYGAEVVKVDIYATISGFGTKGELSQYAAYDNVIQAMSGVMDVNGFADKGPTKIGPAIGDSYSGLLLLLGIEKGMKKISDWNVYFCIALLIFIFVAGNTQFILDSLVNSLGILAKEFPRMTLWTDTVAKISKGHTVRENIINMLITGTAGLFLFFGIVTAYQQSLRIDGILDVPAMLMNGESEFIATQTINTLPFSKIAMVLYLVVIVLFLATTLDATSFTLSSTIEKNLEAGQEPNKKIKFARCLLLVAIPIGIAYVGTDISTIKAIVLATGLPLLVILVIIYYGFLRELKKDFGSKTKDEILALSHIEEEE